MDHQDPSPNRSAAAGWQIAQDAAAAARAAVAELEEESDQPPPHR